MESPTKFTEILNVTLNTSSFIAIESTKPCRAFIAKCRDDAAWQMSLTNTGTTYATHRTLSGDLERTAEGGGVLFYAKATAGSPVLEVTLTK